MHMKLLPETGLSGAFPAFMPFMNWGTGCHLLMKRLKFKTSGELLIVLEDMPQID